MAVKGNVAIAGLGITDMGKIYGRSATNFAVEAIALALEDAGLHKRDVDGLLINGNLSPEMDANFQLFTGFENLTLLNTMSAYGSTPATMLQYAATAISEGQAKVVVLLYADAPLQANVSAGGSYATVLPPTGMVGLPNAYGFYGANPGYAMGARRHMHLYGTKSEQFGAIAVAQRQWALMYEKAQMRKPLTLEEHQASRSRTSTCSSSTTATRTPSSSRSRTTASAPRAKAARSSRTASWDPAARCRRTPAAANSRRSTCGGSRRCQRA